MKESINEAPASVAAYSHPWTTDADWLPSDTSWLFEPTTGVHSFGGGSDIERLSRLKEYTGLWLNRWFGGKEWIGRWLFW
jgi:hypothetical protein